MKHQHRLTLRRLGRKHRAARDEAAATRIALETRIIAIYNNGHGTIRELAQICKLTDNAVARMIRAHRNWTETMERHTPRYEKRSW